MGLEFLPICDVLFNVVSLASYFCDVVFDVIASYTFAQAGHTAWFWLSLASILLSLLTCQAQHKPAHRVFSIYQKFYRSVRGNKN